MVVMVTSGEAGNRVAIIFLMSAKFTHVDEDVKAVDIIFMVDANFIHVHGGWREG